MSRPLLARLVATGAASALLLSGCSFLPGQDEPTAADPSATVPPQGQEDLARYYEQDLSWGDCEGGAEGEIGGDGEERLGDAARDGGP